MNAQLALDLHARPDEGRRFFITTRLNPTQLGDAIARATGQDEEVVALFRLHRTLTPSRCHALYVAATGKGRVPLTSIRRSVSVLTRLRVLRKTDAVVEGPWGQPEHLWVLA